MVQNFQKPQGYESGGTNFMSIVTYKWHESSQGVGMGI